MSAMPKTPYKGLTPYSEEDAPFFFGREEEREIICANLMASRLTVLYGASGVGKSSVLRAGVAHHLRQLAQHSLAESGRPEFAVVVFSAWRDDPVAGLLECVKDAVARTLGDEAQEPLPPSPTLAQTLQAWAQRAGGELFIILDQFEEFFLYHPLEQAQETFAAEFARCVNCPDLRVNFLVSIREDSLAKLDLFKGRIPTLFHNYLRIEYLDLEAGRAAIEKPIEQFNRLQLSDEERVNIEPALVEAVLEQVRTGRVVLGEIGRGAIDDGPGPARVEAPYLQLVMTRLWDEEMRAGSRVLRLQTLKRLGGAERIVGTHLDAVMSALPPRERDVAASVFYHLVTPSGTKIAHSEPDLAEFVRIEEADLSPVLEKLSGPRVRILRGVAPAPDQPEVRRYEIYHDVMAPAILDWRARHTQAQQRANAEKELAQERRRVVRLRLGMIGLSLLLVAMVALYLVAMRARNDAEAARNDAVAAGSTAIAERNLKAAAESTAVAERDLKAAAESTAVAERSRAEKQVTLVAAAQSTAVTERDLKAAAELTAVGERNRAEEQARLAAAAELTAVAERDRAEAAHSAAMVERDHAEAAGGNGCGRA
jgi:hypothetical protein